MTGCSGLTMRRLRCAGVTSGLLGSAMGCAAGGGGGNQRTLMRWASLRVRVARVVVSSHQPIKACTAITSAQAMTCGAGAGSDGRGRARVDIGGASMRLPSG